MFRKRPLAWALCGAVFGLLISVPHAVAVGDLIFKTSDRAQVALERMVKDLQGARFVFIGESHDNREHHEAQLKVIRALVEAGSKVAIGLEMFRTDAQPKLDGWVSGRVGEDEFFRVFSDHWSFNWWHLYLDIFLYSREKRLPMLGLNVPRSVVNQVAREGFASLSETQKRELGAVACDVDPKYRALLRELIGEKDEGGRRFQYFCEAQLVWDAAMAQRLVAFAEKNPQHVVVVLAGIFHTWKHGIPEQVARLTPLPYRVILPSSDKSFLRYDILTKDADYVWFHD